MKDKREVRTTIMSTTPKMLTKLEKLCEEHWRTIQKIVSVSFRMVQVIPISDSASHSYKFCKQDFAPKSTVLICQQVLDDPTFIWNMIIEHQAWVYVRLGLTWRLNKNLCRVRVASTKPNKARQVKITTKSIIIRFFNIHWIVHH